VPSIPKPDLLGTSILAGRRTAGTSQRRLKACAREGLVSELRRRAAFISYTAYASVTYSAHAALFRWYFGHRLS
jgi:hypothetical protein